MSKIASNSDNKKQLAFFEKISGIDNNLYQAGIESKFTEPKQKEEFKKYRLEWTSCVNTVRNNLASVLVNELEKNEEGFEKGIEEINQEIQKINDTVGFLNFIGEMIKTVKKIVRLGI